MPSKVRLQRAGVNFVILHTVGRLRVRKVAPLYYDSMFLNLYNYIFVI